MSDIVVLDRDGVINEDSDQFIKSANEWLPIPGSIEAMGRLFKAGFTLVVITNQSGIGRGLFTEETLDAMHQKLRALLEEQGGQLASILYCPHLPDDGCDCRKPRSGMFRQAEQQLGISLKDAWAVGDSLRDLQAANDVGAKSVLVLTGKGRKTRQNHAQELPAGTQVFEDLASFVDALIGQN